MLFGKKKKKEKGLTGVHISGLDVSENVNVTLSLNEDGVTIKTTSKEYHIGLNKIQSVSWYNEVDIQKYTTSSLGSAVVGAATFGVIGAVIGSRPKVKESKTVFFYLIVQYDEKYIVIESQDGFKVGQIVDFYKELKPESSNKIEL